MLTRELIWSGSILLTLIRAQNGQALVSDFGVSLNDMDYGVVHLGMRESESERQPEAKSTRSAANCR